MKVEKNTPLPNDSEKHPTNLDPNVEAYNKDFDSLLANHEGKFVAYLDGKRVGLGNIRNDLIKQVYDETGETGLFITKVGNKTKTHKMRSPRKVSVAK